MRILVVDDDRLRQHFLAYLLPSLGHEPQRAWNGADAVEPISCSRRARRREADDLTLAQVIFPPMLTPLQRARGSRLQLELGLEGLRTGDPVNVLMEGVYTSQAAANVAARAGQLQDAGLTPEQIRAVLRYEMALEGGSLDAAPNNPVSGLPEAA